MLMIDMLDRPNGYDSLVLGCVVIFIIQILDSHLMATIVCCSDVLLYL